MLAIVPALLVGSNRSLHAGLTNDGRFSSHAQVTPFTERMNCSLMQYAWSPDAVCEDYTVKFAL